MLYTGSGTALDPFSNREGFTKNLGLRPKHQTAPLDNERKLRAESIGFRKPAVPALHGNQDERAQ